MEALKYKVIASDKQYDKYCNTLEELVFSSPKTKASLHLKGNCPALPKIPRANSKNKIIEKMGFGLTVTNDEDLIILNHLFISRIIINVAIKIAKNSFNTGYVCHTILKEILASSV